MTSLPTMSADRVLSAQALFAARFIDAVTERPVVNSLDVRLGDAGTNATLSGLSRRLVADAGLVAWYGDPRTTLGRLATDPCSITITASASGYRETSLTLDLAVGDGAVQDVALNRPYGDLTVSEWEWEEGLDPNPLRLELRLEPWPIALRGQVREQASLFAPVSGADVRIVAPGPNPPVQTDDAGFYAFDFLPRVATITVIAERAGYESVTREIELDYARPLNIADFAMTQVP